MPEHLKFLSDDHRDRLEAYRLNTQNHPFSVLNQQYKSIENLINSDEKITIPEEFKNKYVASRGLFKVFDGKIDLENLPISVSKYDSDGIYKYLVNSCNMNVKRVQNSLQKF